MRTSSLCLLLLAFFLVVTTIAAQSSSSSSSSSSGTGAVATGGAGAGGTTGTTTKPATATLNWFHGWNYIFALGLIFAFWDAYGIGANDVANSFATSVGSKSLTLFQACMIACVVEFLGAILVGSAVADTIRGKLIDVNLFKGNPALLALVMLCALIGSSTWVLAATRFGFPVSTTHSIVGAVMGSAIAAYGPDVIRWSYEGNGFSQIVASWFISPALASAIASGVFLSVEFIVLRSNNPFQRGLWTIPFYFGGTTCLIVFAFIYKGSPALKLDTKFTQDEAGAIAGGIGAFFFLFAIVAYMPWLKKRVLAWEQEEMAKAAAEQESVNNAGLAPAGSDIALSVIPSSDEGNNGDDITKPTQVTFHDKDLDTETATKLAADAEEGVGTAGATGSSSERNSSTDLQKSPPAYTSSSPTNASHEKHQSQHDLLSKQQYHEDNWIIPVRDCLIGVPKRIWNQLRYGLTVDVTHHPQLEEMHNRAPKFDNKTERMYSFLQILTATFASFSHGSNDVANAVAPLSTIYYVYEHSWNTNVPSKTDVPLWIYAFCGIALNIGLLTYGYNIMRELGNKLTYHSPARGFSMELGAAISVLVASRQGWPVSTTHCITGATIGVGLCARDPKAVNWWRASAYFFGWLITVPAAGLMAGLTFAIIAYSPKSYTLSQNGY